MLRLMHVRMIAFSIGKTMPVPIHAQNVKPPDGNLKESMQMGHVFTRFLRRFCDTSP
jgi:hypothetical protein